MSLWETNMGASFGDTSGITKKASSSFQSSHPRPFSRKWAFKNILKTKNPNGLLLNSGSNFPFSHITSGPLWEPVRAQNVQVQTPRMLLWKASYSVPQDPDQIYPIWNPSSAFLPFENLLPSCPEQIWHDLVSLRHYWGHLQNFWAPAFRGHETLVKFSLHLVLESLRETATPLHLHILWGCFANKTAHLSIYNRHHVIRKPKIFTFWPFTEAACQPLA